MTPIDYESLFGAQDFCHCDDCRSVYSPAAYLVDILHSLTKDQRDKLFARRPDIGKTYLSCANTNTPLPYIDLVNELLETAIAPRQGNDPWPQTSWTADQLAANAQFVRDAAYAATRSAVYSWDLPFDPALLEARALLEHLGVSHADLLATFRRGDETWADRSDAAVAAESLGLTPFERFIIIGSLPVRTATDAEIPDIKAIRLDNVGGIQVAKGDYVFVQNQTKNEENGVYVVDDQASWTRLDLMPLLISVTEGDGRGLWKAFLDESGNFKVEPINLWDFWGLDKDWLSSQQLNKSYDQNNKKEAAGVALALAKSGLTYNELVELLTTRFINPDLTNPLRILFPDQANCDINQASFARFVQKGNIRILAPDLTPDLADKIQRFTRLRRKLGWSATDLDKVLTAFQGQDITDATLLQIAHARQLSSDLNLPLVVVLSWWGNLDTTPDSDGSPSLYEQTFRNKTVLAQSDNDDFALTDDGSELKTPGGKVTEHIAAAIAGLGISASELSLLIKPDGDVPDEMNLANLSALFRVASCSRALGLSVKDFVSLRTLSGLDSFDSANVANARRFVRLAGKVRSSGFTIAQLNYVCRHKVDALVPEGLVPQPAEILSLAKILRDGLQKIADDNRIAADPKGELTRKKLGVLWKAELVDQMIGLLDGTTIYSTPLLNAPANFTNGSPNFDEKDGQNGVPQVLADRVSWDNGTLSIIGPLSEDNKTSLAKLDGGNASYQSALQSLSEQPRDFLTNNAQGFLTSDGVPKIQDVYDALINAKPILSVDERFQYILERLLPYLRDLQSRGLVKQRLTDELKLRPGMADCLLDGNGPLNSRLQDFLDTVIAGLTGQYCKGGTFQLPPDLTRVDAGVTFDSDIAAFPVSNFDVKFCAHWTGKLLAQYSEPYTFFVDTDDQAVSLWIDDQQVIGGKAVNPLTLKAGQLYDLRLEYAHTVNRAWIELMWSSPSTPKSDIPAAQLYPQSVLDAFAASFTLLQKVALLVNGFKLSVKEVTYLSAHESDFADLNFGAFPLDEKDAKVDFFNQWERLCDLVSLRNALPGGAALIDVFAAAATGKLEDAEAALVSISGWNSQSLDELITHGFNLSAGDLVNEVWPTRLAICMQIVSRLGVATSDLFLWAGLQLDTHRAEIKNAAKSKYDDAGWLAIAKPLQNNLREMRRDALVGYLTANGIPDGKGGSIKFAGANGLFDYFLIDPEMSSCQLTSRIKQAVGSTQLFIMRSLLNLEDGVQLTEDEATHWQSWMSRYRVWEANRKIFLYPENWIEPELRRDKTPFFKELENELMQEAITADTAEEAFRNYLEKLDEVSRLEPAGIYHDKPSDIYHIFARTPTGQPRIYYYRRLEKSVWTPWEKVNVDIQGDHLIPVIWNRRLRILWPIFIKQQEPGPTTEPPTPITIIIQMAWSEYKNGKWTAKRLSATSTTDGLKGDGHLEPRQEGPLWDPTDLSSYVFKSVVNKATPPDRGEDLVIRCLHRADKGVWEDLDGKYFLDNSVSGMMEGQFIFRGSGDVLTKDFTFFDSDSLSLLVPDGTDIKNMTFTETGNPPDPATPLTLYEPNDILKIPNEITILAKTPAGTFVVLYPPQFDQFYSNDNFFFSDDRRVFFVTPEPGFVEIKNMDMALAAPGMTGQITMQIPYEYAASPIVVLPGPADGSVEVLGTGAIAQDGSGIADNQAIGILNPYATHTGYLFTTFYHPYVREMIALLNDGGIEELLKWPMEPVKAGDDTPTDLTVTYFEKYYGVDEQKNVVAVPYPAETLDVANEGSTPYSLYNWEVFFHAPLLIAQRLTQNQNFEAAQKWFHYIFDPTDRTGYGAQANRPTARFWKFRRFFDDTYAGDPETLEELLDSDRNLEKMVDSWKDNPFDPHLIARSRLVAYQKNVVMKYLDNLIAWGDQLFRQETIEALNEAAQLYVLAAEILGLRPVEISNPTPTTDQVAFDDLENIDAFSNDLVKIENVLKNLSPDGAGSNSAWRVVQSLAKQAPVFCLPQNDKLLGYWDTVADRLFKIWHCMNIEGVVRQLPLFEPPIDPALLVKAAAAGVDLGSVLNQLTAPLPYYRFMTVAQKAAELCGEVKVLGGSLLSALEKRDGEALANLRAQHETELLDLVTQVKQGQIDEAQNTWEGLQQSRAVVQTRQAYYQQRLNEGVSESENAFLRALDESRVMQGIQIYCEVVAGIIHLVPDSKLGAPTTIGATYGGSNLAPALSAFGSSVGLGAAIRSSQGTSSSTSAGYDRRAEEWKLQLDLATAELIQIDKQILAAQVRVDIAKHEMTNHLKQQEQAAEVLDFMHSKYTNQDLYNWMVGQISAVYFQSYQLAYDFAKKAEAAYQFELADYDATFIQFGYWDSLNKGLLAGEKLAYDLRRMETAFLDTNKREYEITRNVSLMQLDPLALLALKQNGECFFSLPEMLFDLDYPGHYMRRIKTLSVTIPCVTGPYTGINGTLTLLKNSVRVDSKPGNSYPRDPKRLSDPRFRDNVGTIESIAISGAQNDSGMFEVTLRDERRLPFEGAGAISDWRLTLDKDANRFDFETITDTILQVRYTAREGGEALKIAVKDTFKPPLPGVRMFSLRHEYPDAWYRFLHPADDDATQTVVADLSDRFPYSVSGQPSSAAGVDVFMKILGADQKSENIVAQLLDADGKNLMSGPLQVEQTINDLYHAVSSQGGNIGVWKLSFDCTDGSIPNAWADVVTVNGKSFNHFKPEIIEDIVLVVRYGGQ